jgi:hypothetical protein
MDGSTGAVLTLGFGAPGSIGLVLTLGLGTGEVAAAAYYPPQFSVARLNVGTLDLERVHVGTLDVARKHVKTLEVER